MALKIRLRQQGRTNRPFYRIVLADSRSPRDGKYLEALGWYNPFETELERNLSVDAGRVQHWLNLGAQISDNVKALVVKASPEVVQAYRQKALEYKAKMTQKKREKRKARKQGAA